MLIKLFILGRPGTGKSTAARFMVGAIQKHGWHVQHIDDYDILYSMYENDFMGRFRRASKSLKGFDVLDYTVFDEALVKLRERVKRSLTRSLNRMKLVIIEFARGRYRTSLEQFKPDFLRESYFLFLDTDIETCIDRIRQRALHPVHKGDRFISRKAMFTFYAHNDIPATVSMLKREYDLDRRHIHVIKNISTEQEFLGAVYQFVENIVACEISK